MNIEEIMEYCCYSCGNHQVVAGFSNPVKGESVVFLDGEMLSELPADYVLGFHIHSGDLYVIYNRAIRRIPSIDGGNTTPDEGYTLEMQDYYSYESPQMLSGNSETLWAHIGGRLFRREGDGWTQMAEFPIGDKAVVTDEGMLQFSKNLLYDYDTSGFRSYDPATGKVTVVNN